MHGQEARRGRESERDGPGACLEIRSPALRLLQTCGLTILYKHTFLLPGSLLGDKETSSLLADSMVTHEPEASLNTK